MKTASFQKGKAYIVLGAIGVFLTAGYMGMSFQLPFGRLDRPGAAVFPVLVGILLLLASLVTMKEGWQMDRVEQIDLPTGSDRNRLLKVIGLMFGYFLVLPWLGQIISSTVFCILLIRVLSNMSWPRVVAYSLAVSIPLNIVFVFMFKVPMPRGVYYLY